jgi:Holliday junction resolvase RusA-like endonuclease
MAKRNKIWDQVIDGTQKSVNHIYLRSRHGRMYTPKDAKYYKEMISEAAEYTYKNPMSEQSLYVEISYTFPDRRRRDVTNYDKPILDSLEGIIYKDDTQIQEIRMTKKVVKGVAETHIKIYEIDTTED